MTPLAAATTTIPMPTARLATPGPTVPAGLPRTAAGERDGLRLEIELQRNPMPAGRLSWVKISLTNGRRTDVTVMVGGQTEGCASLAYVTGASAVPWSMGAEQPGNVGFVLRSLLREK